MSSSNPPPTINLPTPFAEWLADLERLIMDPTSDSSWPSLDRLEGLPERMIESLQAITTEICKSGRSSSVDIVHRQTS